MIAYVPTYQGQLLNEVDKLEQHVLALESRLKQVALSNSTLTAVTVINFETGGGVQKDKARPHASTRVGAKGREVEHYV